MKTDTIAAISTPFGIGGVAVIRISGGDAIEIADKVFHTGGKKLSETPHARARYGGIFDGETQIDDGIFTVFRAPHSYTGEDTVEISCHGGVYVTNRVLTAVLSAGARPAEAGEFTRRAFLSGKLSLSEAESVGDLLYAKTEGQLLLSGSASSSKLREKTDEITKMLTSLIARISVTIDYPEEDLSDIEEDEVMEITQKVFNSVDKLSASYKTGRAVSHGIDAVICGRPNAGKSTLYNTLLGEDAAIVTDIAGTTRDTLTSEVAVGKVLLKLSDTAGIRETDDKIESIGVERAQKKVSEAELVIALYDATSEPTDDDKHLFDDAKNAKYRLAVINKTETTSALYADLYKKIAEENGADTVFASLISGEGKDEITKKVESAFTDPTLELGRDAVIGNARQAAEAKTAREHLTSAIDELSLGLPLDIVSCELEAALSSLLRLDGRDVTDTVIHEIFSKFCVGK